MRRREIIAGLGCTAALPAVVRAQQPAMPVVGYLYPGASRSAEPLLAAFRRGLSEIGYIEGHNVAIELRVANNEYARLPELFADLVRRRVAVIAVFGQAAFTVKADSTSIPIVFNMGFDPVETGLVTSLNRPGGNITGITTISVELTAKRLGLLHDLLPQATRFAVLVDSTQDTAASYSTNIQTAASAGGSQTETFAASTSGDIDAAFARIVQKRADALFVTASSFFRDRIVQLATLAVRHAVPAIFVERAFSEAGGLMSYGANLLDQTRLSGAYVARILKGEKPADLPVQQAARIELIINLQTAKILGLTVPETLLATADEVIQ
jgi:putative ABC transport system substrate-binding protein